MTKKIITHGGQWHADEVSAIALFSIIHELQPIVSVFPLDSTKEKEICLFKPGMLIPVERKFFVSDEELEDPTVMVLDIGIQNDLDKKRVYDLSLANLDHHQDTNLVASNILMINYLWDLQEDKKVFGKLQELLFGRISNIDKGIIPGGGESWEFNSIIRGCEDFVQAIELSTGIISRMISDIEKSFEDAKLFNALPTEGVVVINTSSNILLGWKELAEERDLIYMVTPNLRGVFRLMSKDSVNYRIGVEDNQTFRHNSGFMAVYATQEEAILAGNNQTQN